MAKLLFATVIGCLLLLISCQQEKTSKTYQKQVIDDQGDTIALVIKPRVMALTPALTEALFEVCDTAQIIAVTQNCNYPKAANHKPRVNTFPLDIEGLLAQKPDLIVTQATMTDPSSIDQMRKQGFNVYVFKHDNLADLITDFKTLGIITGNAQKGQALYDSLNRVFVTYQAEAEAPCPRPRTLGLIWTDPIIVFGSNTLFSEILYLSGGQNVLTEPQVKQFPDLSREQLMQLDPEIILGPNLAKLEGTFFNIYPEMKGLKAYKNKRIIPLADDLASRPSPRILQLVEQLKPKLSPCSRPGLAQ